MLIDGLPALTASGDEPATLTQLMLSTLSYTGIERALSLMAPLRAQDEQAFLYVFIGLNIALLLGFLAFLFSAVAGTTFKGAPICHRLLGLQISERRNGYFPTPLRACVRWMCFMVLLPLVPVGIFMRRGLHDIIAGCQIDPR